MYRSFLSLALALGLASAAVAVAHTTASAVAAAAPRPCAATVPPGVTVQGGVYTPTTLSVSRPGSTVTWDFHGGTANAASATSTNLTLFDSHPKGTGSYRFTFWSAGSYLYHSTTNPSQKGTIAVKMCNVPATAHVNSTVYMQPASSHHTGWVADIEVKRPGSSSWSVLKSGVATTMASFVPTKKGTYSLRARLRNTTSSQASAYSPASTVKVS